MRKSLAAVFVAVLVAPGASLAALKRAQYPPPPRKLVRAVHRIFHGHHEQTAFCEAWVESHYDRLRRVRGSSWSSTGDHGFFQINYVAHHRPGESEWHFHRRMSSVWANVEAAYAISSHGTNWTPWSTYMHGYCHGLN